MADAQKAKAFALALTYENITKDFIEQNLCAHYDKETNKIVNPEYSFQDEFTLKKGEYLNTTDVKTNIGLVLVNKLLYGNTPAIRKELGYVNEPYSKKVIQKLEDRITKGIMEGRIPADEYAKYLDNIQWLGNTFNSHVSCSFTPDTAKMLPSVKERRKVLYKENEEALKNGDVVLATKITDELLKTAKNELKNDIGMTIYDSGCKPKFDNSYRSMYVSRGPIANPAEEKFDITHNSLIEGVRRDEVAPYGNSVINGAYNKAIGTKKAGYLTKKLNTCFQSVKADKHGSDCGTTRYRSVTITKDNAPKLVNRYYLKGKTLDILTMEKLNSFIGKTIQIRSPLYCTGKRICNKCLGETPYILGLENIGLITSQLGGKVLSLHMKSFHDTTVHIKTFGLKDIFIE